MTIIGKLKLECLRIVIADDADDHAAVARRLLLADADGTPLPMQMEATLRQSVADPTTLTVTFLVDGDHVKLG